MKTNLISLIALLAGAVSGHEGQHGNVVRVEQKLITDLEKVGCDNPKYVKCSTVFDLESMKFVYNVTWDNIPSVKYEGSIGIVPKVEDGKEWKIRLEFATPEELELKEKYSKFASLEYFSGNYTALIGVKKRNSIEIGYNGTPKMAVINDAIYRVTFFHQQDYYLFELTGPQWKNYRCHQMVSWAEVFENGKLTFGKIEEVAGNGGNTTAYCLTSTTTKPCSVSSTTSSSVCSTQITYSSATSKTSTYSASSGQSTSSKPASTVTATSSTTTTTLSSSSPAPTSSTTTSVVATSSSTTSAATTSVTTSASSSTTTTSSSVTTSSVTSSSISTTASSSSSSTSSISSTSTTTTSSGVTSTQTTHTTAAPVFPTLDPDTDTETVTTMDPNTDTEADTETATWPSTETLTWTMPTMDPDTETETLTSPTLTTPTFTRRLAGPPTDFAAAGSVIEKALPTESIESATTTTYDSTSTSKTSVNWSTATFAMKNEQGLNTITPASASDSAKAVEVSWIPVVVAALVAAVLM